jgi:hypothetical protein
VVLAFGVLVGPAGAATFEVTTTGDTGDTGLGDNACVASGGGCTLRAAIQQANATANSPAATPDTISFEFAAAGIQTIVIGSALDTVTDPVVIDGYMDSESVENSQAAATTAFSADGLGSNAKPTVELDLNDQAGLVISAGNSTVRGLAIYGLKERFEADPLPPHDDLISTYAIELRTNGGNKIEGNFIGLTAAGTVPPDFADWNKGQAVGAISGDNNTIGGLLPEQRNVISANGGSNGAGGIHFEGGTNSKIQGNLIGTTPAGTAIPTITLDPMVGPQDVNNGQRGGIEVNGFHLPPIPIVNLVIGGTADHAGNVISGNTHDGNSGAITINADDAVNQQVKVLGNRIGTNAAGTALLGNNTGGGVAADTPTAIGDDAGHGNLIVGSSNGITETGGSHTIQGNRIGTNREGTLALPSGNGIRLRGDNSLIGGIPTGSPTPTQPGNLISGNTFNGIDSDVPVDNDIQGNFIGTNAAGTAALPNGQAGIALFGGLRNTIGGAAAGSENVISGNGGPGIFFGLPEGTQNDENEVLGNKIGVSATGTALGNGGPGVQVHNGFNNVIGRAVAGEGNTITFNGGDGVLISGIDERTFGTEAFHNDGNSIRGNSIFTNGQLGIDLGEDNSDEADDGDGITPNDPLDPDSGNNALQNFPLVNAALPGASTFVRGFTNSRPNTTYMIDVYRATTCDASGNGEGVQYLGSTSATTNAFGNALWNTTVAITVPLGQFVTATATDPAGNTSEFSACRQSGTQVADQAIEPPAQEQPQQTPQPEQQQLPQTQTQPQPQPQPQPQAQPQPQPAATACRDRKPPITTLKRAGVKQTARGTKLELTGTSADHRDCPSGVQRVDVSLARVAGRTGVNCRFIKKPDRYQLTRPQNCRRPVLFRATGTGKWTFTFPVRLKPGRYRVQARGTDKARNKETPKKRRNIVDFEVR